MLAVIPDGKDSGSGRGAATRRVSRPRHQRSLGLAMALAVPILLLALIAVVADTKQWPGGLNAPGMDLSRRSVLVAAGVVALYGATMVGFALGNWWPDALGRSAWRREFTARRRNKILIGVGTILVIAGMRYGYLALAGSMP